MKLGQSIKKLRKEMTKLNQCDFACKIGISQTYLSQIENDLREPSTEILQRVANYLQIPLPILFWHGITIEDVNPKKLEYFLALKPTIDSMMNCIFSNEY